MRAELHSYGAECAEPDLESCCLQVEAVAHDHNLEDFMRKAGGLKHELLALVQVSWLTTFAGAAEKRGDYGADNKRALSLGDVGVENVKIGGSEDTAERHEMDTYEVSFVLYFV